MLMKYCVSSPTIAAQRNTSPTCEAMNGHRMYSPEAIPTPTRITLGPTSLRSGGASGSSRRVTGPICASGIGAGATAMRSCLPGTLYVITYTCMATEALPAIGPRVRALREAMDLSLRDLALRSGVSAPMLSQVERGETSPTLHVAARIAAGLELRLSQLLRLDEEGMVTIVRADERRTGGAGGDPHEGAPPPLPRPRPQGSP